MRRDNLVTSPVIKQNGLASSKTGGQSWTGCDLDERIFWQSARQVYREGTHILADAIV